jgi:hypothetical protein
MAGSFQMQTLPNLFIRIGSCTTGVLSSGTQSASEGGINSS